MDRINSAGVIVDQNGHRMRQDANLQTGASGTELSAPYDNDLQEELVAGFIEAVGLTPSAANLRQVSTAVQMMIQQQGANYAVDTSQTPNQILLALTPVVTELVDGQMIRFRAANNNTGPVELIVNALQPVPLVGAAGRLQGGEIITGGQYGARYDATTQSAVLTQSGAGALPVGPATQSSQAVPLAQLQAAIAESAANGAATVIDLGALPAPLPTPYVPTAQQTIIFNSSNNAYNINLGVGPKGAEITIYYPTYMQAATPGAINVAVAPDVETGLFFGPGGVQSAWALPAQSWGLRMVSDGVMWNCEAIGTDYVSQASATNQVPQFGQLGPIYSFGQSGAVPNPTLGVCYIYLAGDKSVTVTLYDTTLSTNDSPVIDGLCVYYVTNTTGKTCYIQTNCETTIGVDGYNVNPASQPTGVVAIPPGIVWGDNIANPSVTMLVVCAGTCVVLNPANPTVIPATAPNQAAQWGQVQSLIGGRTFVSAPQVPSQISGVNFITLPHNLGAVPTCFGVYLVNVTPELGYNTGDLAAALFNDQKGDQGLANNILRATSTDLIMATGGLGTIGTTISALAQIAGENSDWDEITYANWNLIFWAKL